MVHLHRSVIIIAMLLASEWTMTSQSHSSDPFALAVDTYRSNPFRGHSPNPFDAFTDEPSHSPTTGEAFDAALTAHRSNPVRNGSPNPFDAFTEEPSHSPTTGEAFDAALTAHRSNPFRGGSPNPFDAFTDESLHSLATHGQHISSGTNPLGRAPFNPFDEHTITLQPSPRSGVDTRGVIYTVPARLHAQHATTERPISLDGVTSEALFIAAAIVAFVSAIALPVSAIWTISDMNSEGKTSFTASVFNLVLLIISAAAFVGWCIHILLTLFSSSHFPVSTTHELIVFIVLVTVAVYACAVYTMFE